MASKLKELMKENGDMTSQLKELANGNSMLEAKLEQNEREKGELQRLVEFMKNAGYNQEQNMLTESQSKQGELS